MKDDRDFFIISDHGQINISRVMCPNVELARRGLIDVDAEGNVRDSTAMVKSTGASAQRLPEGSHRQGGAGPHGGGAGRHVRKAGTYGISRVYTAAEAEAEEHLAGDFSFVIETDGYTSFGNDWMAPMCRAHDTTDYRFGRATHGHQPDKGPQPTLIAFGPSIKPGVVLDSRRIVDEPVTVAKVLGLDMGDVDGHAIDEILR